MAMSTRTGPTVTAVVGPTALFEAVVAGGVLAPEDGGGVAVELGEEIFDSGRGGE
jgi:hypothetical protein